jgi:hypothetical protein
LTEKATSADVTLFEPRPGTALTADIQKATNVGGQKVFQGENPQPGTAISYYLKSAPSGEVKLTISDYSGKVVRTFNPCAKDVTQNCATTDVGLNRVQWNLRGDPPQVSPEVQQRMQAMGGGGRGGRAMGPVLPPGVYVVKLSVGGKEYTTKVVVEEDKLPLM